MTNREADRQAKAMLLDFLPEVVTVLTAARAIAKMKEPSVEGLLRRDGFDYEADRVKELISAIEKLDAGGGA